MRVFVTGGTGLVGSAVIPQLIKDGHLVTALARSDSSSTKITSFGARAIKGVHTDCDVLRKAASEADGVIHLAFNHDLIAVPGGIVQACNEDRAAIAALCDGLLANKNSTDKVFINTSGTLGSLGPDETSTKEPNEHNPRGLSETLTLSYNQPGLRTMNVRLAPVVHGPGYEHPFVSSQISAAKKNGFAAYVGDGQQLWPSIHTLDAGALYAKALVKSPGGVNLHAIDEEGVPVKDIANFIARKLGLKTKSIPMDDPDLQALGFVGTVMSLGGKTTSKMTRAWLSWEPKEYGFFQELQYYSF